MWYRGPSSASRLFPQLLLCPYELPRLVLETEDLHVLSGARWVSPRGGIWGWKRKESPVASISQSQVGLVHDCRKGLTVDRGTSPQRKGLLCKATGEALVGSWGAQGLLGWLRVSSSSGKASLGLGVRMEAAGKQSWWTQGGAEPVTPWPGPARVCGPPAPSPPP